MLLLGTLLTEGGRWRAARWLREVARRPRDFARVTTPWGKARRSQVLLVMQTRPSEMRLALRRDRLAPWRRTLTSVSEPGVARIPSSVPIANQVAREMAAELDAVPQSALNEVLLDVSTTAHVLGGCAIGASPETGVVDAFGRVFGVPGLYVMDGSTVGANLGVNPALTISALAELGMSRVAAKGA
jgi:cholesterol oxidase